jgi:CBS domain-containing membrane protein
LPARGSRICAKLHDMKADVEVSRLMTRRPTTVGPEDRVSNVQALMRKEGIHHVPVVEQGRFVGMLSATDLVRIAFGDPYRMDPEVVDKDLELFTAREVMAEDVVSAAPTDSVRDVAKRLAGAGFHAMPVLDEGRLVGIVTSSDLILYLIDD